jgi:hypothetical protein
MVYSPGVILIRDDDGEWRSPVEVDVLTSAAVNAGEIRYELEREERLRKERLEMESWKKRGEMRKETLTLPSQAPDPDPSITYTLALENAEIQIQQTMHARISRILHLFQLHETPHLILGSFGTGVFKNHIDLIATIFADLLIKPGGRFKDVFHTVMFAILGKETVRVFTKVFQKADKRAQRERKSKKCVFEDEYGSDEDVKEGYEEKRMRMMRWDARRRRNLDMYAIPDAAADAASFDPAQVDAAFDPLSFDAAQASTIFYPTPSAAADAASYSPSSDAALADAAAYAASSNATQASVAYPPSFNTTRASAVSYPTSSAAADAAYPPFVDAALADAAAYAASVASYPPSFDATQTSAIPYPTFFTATQTDAAVQASPTAADYYGIPEDAKMTLTTGGDEQVDFMTEAIANSLITPKAMVNDDAMVVDDGKDIEAVETKSFPHCPCEAQNSMSIKKDDDDIEMQ